MTNLALGARARDGSFKGRKVDGVWTCKDCDRAVGPSPCTTRHRLRCDDCNSFHYLFTTVLTGAQRAGSAVAEARRKGFLQPPADFGCSDCDRQAEQYDHRDYSEPLRVDPVCRSCNGKRGSARPLDQRIVLSLIYQAIYGEA